MIFIVGARPYEISGEAFLIYFTGIIFFGAAIAILFAKSVRTMAALLGLYIFFITVIFYLPLLWTNIYDAQAWATFLKGIAMSGSAFILSRETAKEGTAVLKESIPF